MPEINPALRLMPRRFFAREERVGEPANAMPHFAMRHQAKMERSQGQIYERISSQGA